jgi:hypothetical protein
MLEMEITACHGYGDARRSLIKLFSHFDACNINFHLDYAAVCFSPTGDIRMAFQFFVFRSTFLENHVSYGECQCLRQLWQKGKKAQERKRILSTQPLIFLHWYCNEKKKWKNEERKQFGSLKLFLFCLP